jgi:polyhydroxybutyrate depolymerase
MRWARTTLVALFAAALGGCGGSSEESGAKPSSGGNSASGGSGGDGGLAGGPTGGSAGVAGSVSTGGAAGNGAEGGSGGSGGSKTLCPSPALAPGSSKITLQSSGVERSANLYLPAGYDGKSAVPLVMVFHGYLENAEQVEGLTGLDAVADQNGVALAYAQGLDTSWNAGKCCGTSASVQRPDVQFVSDLIDQISTEVCVDPKRVYATGFSNGGMFSSRLGCELANRIAAIAPVAGPIDIDGCSPSRPLPVIEFHGTSDIVVPYNGFGLGGAISVPLAFDFWKANGGCTASSPTNVYKQGDASCDEYAACAPGVAVRFCTIDQGGHQWPGGNAGGLGKISKDISASEEIVKFFLAHPMP